MFGLVDGNNFYASCERVFRPQLRNKPVMVLSNNDGCVIARSNEVKALGIKMAAPYFRCKDLVKKHTIYVFSANFTLYGDLSQRFMQCLEYVSPHIEVYSIDEAFISLAHVTKDIEAYARRICTKVEKWVGIPVSIGIAQTKTLAKAANKIAKKHDEYQGVCCMTDSDQIDSLLMHISIADVWGVGRQYSKLLRAHGMYTAYDLKYASQEWIRKRMGVPGIRTVLELNGRSCIPLGEQPENRKSIMTSRTFKKEVRTWKKLQKAIARFTSLATEKLRTQESLATHLYVFIRSNRFKQDKFYANSSSYGCMYPTAHTPELIQYATAALRTIYKPEYGYKQAGVGLSGIISEKDRQYDLFNTYDDKKRTMMRAVDAINKQWGSNTLHSAATHNQSVWGAHRHQKSPRYTTNWNELLEISV